MRTLQATEIAPTGLWMQDRTVWPECRAGQVRHGGGEAVGRTITWSVAMCKEDLTCDSECVFWPVCLPTCKIIATQIGHVQRLAKLLWCVCVPLEWHTPWVMSFVASQGASMSSFSKMIYWALLSTSYRHSTELGGGREPRNTNCVLLKATRVLTTSNMQTVVLGTRVHRWINCLNLQESQNPRHILEGMEWPQLIISTTYSLGWISTMWYSLCLKMGTTHFNIYGIIYQGTICLQEAHGVVPKPCI